MGDRLGCLLRLCWKDGLGFGLFLAWVYCTLFGCGLAVDKPALDGTPATLGLECIWQFSGIAQALAGVAGLVACAVFSQRGTSIQPHVRNRTALVLGISSNVILWTAWLERGVWFDRLFWVGGLLSGFAIALFISAWGERLSSTNEARIEFVVPLAFTVSFLVYLAQLFCKQSSQVDLVCIAAMCAGSFGVLSLRPLLAPEDAHDSPHLAEQGKPSHGTTPPASACDSGTLRGLVSFSALVCASWIQIAFFRVISTPALAGNRFTHYLYPFLMACALSFAMLLLCIRVSRHLNITLVFRWCMPLFVASYAPLVAGYSDPTLRMAGYALNFLGMFGVQYGCWLGASKYVRRSHIRPQAVFSCLALGEGLGIAVGCMIGFAAHPLPFRHMFSLALLVLALVQLTTMVAGFNPSWVFRRSRGDADYPARETSVRESALLDTPQAVICPTDSRPAPVPATNEMPTAEPSTAETVCPDPSALEALFHQQASWLQATYQLTNRETEVAELLLAGRSRPFIRDELCLSLNTVGVHVRNLFAKCNVHSRQELIDLARNKPE